MPALRRCRVCSFAILAVLCLRSEILPYQWREPRWATELRQLIDKAIAEKDSRTRE